MPPAKPWYESWVLWFNVLTLVVTVAGVFTDPALASDPRIVTVAIAVVTAGNAALRILRTAQPIAGTPMAARAKETLNGPAH
jgi:hypothetical protein